MNTATLKQFYEFKEKYPDAVLLFRAGDYYEAYEQDAKRASAILGVTIHRTSKNGEETDWIGFPHHSLDIYLPKLVRHGCRVAICDQLEDPKETKKLVKRGITEKVQPERGQKAIQLELFKF